MFGPEEAGGTCPGATSGPGGCISLKKLGGKVRTCYMDKLVKAYPALGKVLTHNTDILKNKTVDEMVVILRLTVLHFIEESDNTDLYFRLHYSGDFFSIDYAKAWSIVIKEFKQVQFWVYTRSFIDELNVLPFLVDNDNLTLFLSVDPVNKELGFKAYEPYKDKKNVGLAWMGNTKPESYRWVTCPETSGKISNKPNMGACGKCRLCVDNYNHKVKNIQFLIH